MHCNVIFNAPPTTYFFEVLSQRIRTPGFFDWEPLDSPINIFRPMAPWWIEWQSSTTMEPLLKFIARHHIQLSVVHKYIRFSLFLFSDLQSFDVRSYLSPWTSEPRLWLALKIHNAIMWKHGISPYLLNLVCSIFSSIMFIDPSWYELEYAFIVNSSVPCSIAMTDRHGTSCWSMLGLAEYMHKNTELHILLHNIT